MVHLHMKVFQIMKNAILITIGNPINSIVSAAWQRSHPLYLFDQI